MKNLISTIIILVLFGCAYNLFKYDKSPDSLMKDACNCYSEAKNIRNSDAMGDKMKECQKFMDAANDKLRKQAKEEDWPDEKVAEISNQLYKKYNCGNDDNLNTSNTTHSNENYIAETDKPIESNVHEEQVNDAKATDVDAMKEVFNIFYPFFKNISEGRELLYYRTAMGDLNNDGVSDAVLQYSLKPSADDLGGDGIEHPSQLTGLIVYLNKDGKFEQVDYNNKDGFAYNHKLTSISNGIISLIGDSKNLKLTLQNNRLVLYKN